MGEMGEVEFQALYGEWTPRDEKDVVTLMEGFPGDWWVAGGRALEAFTGVEREHDDIDVAILRCDLPAFRRHVAGRWHVWAAFSGALKPVLPSDPDELPEGCGQVWLRRDARSPWDFDVLLNPSGAPGQWVNRRDPSMALPMDQATWLDAEGVRWLNPEIVLLFKAKHLRVKDRADFASALPRLDDARRGWLRDALRRAHPGHEWLAALGGD